MRSLISVSFDILFKNSLFMPCRALLILKSSRMLRSVFCDASRVLTLTSSTKDESSARGILSISYSVGNSRLSLVAALKGFSNADGVSSKLKTLFIIFSPPNFSLNVFAVKHSAVRLLVRNCQWLLPSRKSRSVLPVFAIFFIYFYFLFLFFLS